VQITLPANHHSRHRQFSNVSRLRDLHQRVFADLLSADRDKVAATMAVLNMYTRSYLRQPDIVRSAMPPVEIPPIPSDAVDAVDAAAYGRYCLDNLVRIDD